MKPDVTNDRLGVLSTTRTVVDHSLHVRIDLAVIEQVANDLSTFFSSAPAWSDDLHFRDGTWRTAAWVFVLDALNFCFWSQDRDARWNVTWQGEVHDGYWALVAALRRAVDEGFDVWDPAYLATIPADDVAHILRSDPGSPSIPLLGLRGEHLRELGRGLLDISDHHPVIVVIERANGSAVDLVEDVIRRFPSFNDVAEWNGRDICFYKRAQILVADLAGAFGGEDLGSFTDLERLTAFADYKVPQVLRRLGILVYDGSLTRRLDRWELLPAGSKEEIEIRSATVWGVELLRQALGHRGQEVAAFEVDWMLWQAGQAAANADHPYHRTYTGFY